MTEKQPLCALNDSGQAGMTLCVVVNVNGFVKNLKKCFFVIPVETGIQSFQIVTRFLDSRFRGNDDFLREYHQC
ncbi:hypothetical protein BMS3Abin08_01167 [bacterium BMS3Abin08]|nr:hypothetical protein BMS3Abin08_01167 [bacterium BMS3Abin08]